MATKPSKKFQELLLNFSQTEQVDERKKIEGDLWNVYGAEYAVFVLDMSGFSTAHTQIWDRPLSFNGAPYADDNKAHCQILRWADA